jgi:integrase
MPKLVRRHPSYRLHKPSGQAVVTLDGKDHYLGPHGAEASRVEYDRLIAEWLAHGRRLPTRSGHRDALSVAELILAYWRFAEGHYTRDGRPTRHLDNLRDALRPVKVLYGHTGAAAFDAAALKAVRKSMIDAGLCRNTINGRIGKVRGMFRWAVEEKLVPAAVFQELMAIRGIRRGRDGVRDTGPVRPVPEEHVEAVLPFVSAPVHAMIRLQALTGMRPGEVTALSAADIDRTGEVWAYRPARHKTDGHGHERVILLGPRAQEVITPWLKAEPTAPLFSPAEAVEARNSARRQGRKTPMTPSQARRKRKRNPKRPPRDRYDKNAYRQAIERACKRAGVPVWGPNRLRHALATKVRRHYGLEASQVILGHKSADVTQVYAEADMEKARAVMREIG